MLPAPPTLPMRRFVVKGWLSAIMQTFAEQPAAGIVGPVFLGATDLVQEAGGIVFAGAEAANHGRGKALTHRMYYLREVDYISAACIAFRKAVFQKLGGFDSQVRRDPGRAGGCMGGRGWAGEQTGKGAGHWRKACIAANLKAEGLECLHVGEQTNGWARQYGIKGGWTRWMPLEEALHEFCLLQRRCLRERLHALSSRKWHLLALVQRK
jgi:hypothetical protein